MLSMKNNCLSGYSDFSDCSDCLSESEYEEIEIGPGIKNAPLTYDNIASSSVMTGQNIYSKVEPSSSWNTPCIDGKFNNPYVKLIRCDHLLTNGSTYLLPLLDKVQASYDIPRRFSQRNKRRNRNFEFDTMALYYLNITKTKKKEKKKNSKKNSSRSSSSGKKTRLARAKPCKKNKSLNVRASKHKNCFLPPPHVKINKNHLLPISNRRPEPEDEWQFLQQRGKECFNTRGPPLMEQNVVIKSEPVDNTYQNVVIKSEPIDDSFENIVVKSEPIVSSFESVAIKFESSDDYSNSMREYEIMNHSFNTNTRHVHIPDGANYQANKEERQRSSDSTFSGSTSEVNTYASLKNGVRQVQVVRASCNDFDEDEVDVENEWDCSKFISKQQQLIEFDHCYHLPKISSTYKKITKKTHNGSKKSKDLLVIRMPEAENSNTDKRKHSPGRNLDSPAMHNFLERKRRKDLANDFKELRDTIPSLEGNVKASKVTILRKAASVIKRLEEDDKLLQDTLRELEKKKKKLTKKYSFNLFEQRKKRFSWQ